MLEKPKDVLTAFPDRKTGRQKQAFLDAVQAYAVDLGYSCTVEESHGCRAMVMGDPDRAGYLVTADYDTSARFPYFGRPQDRNSGVVTLLKIARSLPENQRKYVCFVLYNRKMSGLGGEKNQWGQKKPQMVLNLDCVGSGDRIQLSPTKQLKLDRKRLTSLYKACGYFGKKSILLCERGTGHFPWSQKQYPCGVNICAVNSQGKRQKNTALDQTNINLLRAALITYICRDAVQ